MSTVTLSPIETNPIEVEGTLRIPASKSHTIRALLIASMAEGKSFIRYPLYSADTLSCLSACRLLGAQIIDTEDGWEVIKGIPREKGLDPVYIDVGNSGTSLYLLTAIAATLDRKITFDGDEQIRKRSASNLLDSLLDLGADVQSAPGGCAPYTIQGPLKGGKTSISCPTSQYLSALLLAAPLLSKEKQCHIEVPLLMEKPYAEMTLKWMDQQHIQYTNQNFDNFIIPGGQSYSGFDSAIASDFSSATFFLSAAAITGSTLCFQGLDLNDSQGDKAVIPMLETMGCTKVVEGDKIFFTGADLKGVTLDLNDTPDALPALSVVACFAKGETRIVNVPQARMKETDRIAVMTQELRKMGAQIEETPDGMIIQGFTGDSKVGALKGCEVKGHGDHRVVMALSIASLLCEGQTTIDTAEAVEITYPGFFEQLSAIQ